MNLRGPFLAGAVTLAIFATATLGRGALPGPPASSRTRSDDLAGQVGRWEAARQEFRAETRRYERDRRELERQIDRLRFDVGELERERVGLVRRVEASKTLRIQRDEIQSRWSKRWSAARTAAEQLVRAHQLFGGNPIPDTADVRDNWFARWDELPERLGELADRRVTNRPVALPATASVPPRTLPARQLRLGQWLEIFVTEDETVAGWRPYRSESPSDWTLVDEQQAESIRQALAVARRTRPPARIALPVLPTGSSR